MYKMEISVFSCDLLFTIPGRGLIATGSLLNGNIDIGWWIKFEENENHPQISRKIKAIEASIRFKDVGKIGLLLETKDKFDIEVIKNYNIQNELAYITENS